MKKEINYKNQYSICYPVGSNISKNMPLINEAVAEFCRMEKVALSSYRGTIHLICTGSSGAIIAALAYPIVSSATMANVRISHVKKAGEDSHSPSVPGFEDGDMAIFIDDFIHTGKTVHRVYINMRGELGFNGFDYILMIGWVKSRSSWADVASQIKFGKLYCSK